MTLSVQDQVVNLVVNKGMTERDAIEEIESILHTTLPANIKASIRDSIHSHYYHRARTYGGLEIKDLTNKCYFCETPLSDAYYCYRCGFWLCSEHDTECPVGHHNVRDHLKKEVK